MIVRRHFLPDYFFSHKEFEQITDDSIHAGGQHIRIGQIANLDELKAMSQHWKTGRILTEAQHHIPTKESIYPQRGYGTYAAFWGFMFGIIIMFLQPAWLQVDSRWMLAGTFLLVYFVYIYIIPKAL